MAIHSQITITFNEEISLNTSVEILYGINTQLSSITEKYKTIRTGFGEAVIGTPTLTVGEISAYNFVEAFNVDYNNALQYQVTRTANVVVIKALVPNLYFISGEVFPETSGPIPDVVFLIENISSSDFSINNIAFSQADTNVCSNVKVTFTATKKINAILSPLTSTIAVPDFTCSFDWIRGQNIIAKLRSIDNDIVTTGSMQLPGIIDIINRNVIISPLPAGTSITIYIPSYQLDLEYSLNNTTWQSSNSFSGLLAGNYTVYVRDQFGCQKDFPVVITATNQYSPYFKISKSNPIRFANRIIFGDAANYKNDENTLSCEVDVKLPYKEYLLFQTADVITTQFKSNYGLNEAKIIRPNLADVSVPVIQKSNNMGLTDSRDARIYNLTNGKSGIYFTSGNTYDYLTGMANGTHSLNGQVPIWGVSGNYIKVGTGFYLIEDVIFDDDKNADVIVISNNYTGTDVPQVVSSLYNLFNYEVFEFTIDMVDYIDEVIQLKIINSDTIFQTLTHLSEAISIAVRHHGTVEIFYYNEENTDIFYATGIKNKIRIALTKQGAVDEDDSENHKTDSNTVLLSAEMYEVEQFIFEPSTKEITRRNKQALSHKFVFINGVQYVKDGNFEVDGPLEDTNLYVLTAKMIKTGAPFNNETQSGLNVVNSNSAIPGLIQTDSGFLKYQ